MAKPITLPRFACLRCQHQWHPRIVTTPKRCPNCKSSYWSKTPTRPRVVCVACRKPISLKEVPLCRECRKALP